MIDVFSLRYGCSRGEEMTTLSASTEDRILTSPFKESKMQISLPALSEDVLSSRILVCSSTRSLHSDSSFSRLRMMRMPSSSDTPSRSPSCAGAISPEPPCCRSVCILSRDASTPSLASSLSLSFTKRVRVLPRNSRQARMMIRNRERLITHSISENPFFGSLSRMAFFILKISLEDFSWVDINGCISIE